MNSMPDVVALMQVSTLEEMKSLAKQVKARRLQHNPKPFGHYPRLTAKITAAARVKTARLVKTQPPIVPQPSKTSSAKGANITVRVQVVNASLSPLATSAVALRKQKHAISATPTTMEECVTEKSRIASEI